MISGFKIFLGVLLIILGIGIYIYLKRKKENRQVMDIYKTNQMKNNSTRNPLQYDKKHNEFMKSMNIIHPEKIVLGSILVNGKQEELSAKLKDNGYIYYLNEQPIGGYNPNIIGDDRIIFKENTLENALSDQIKDEIVQVITKSKRKLEQEKERQAINAKLRNQNFYEKEMGYQQSIGVKKETREQQNSQNRIKEREKNNRDKFQEQIRVQQKKRENTIKDISIKQEVDMNTMATDMDTIGERLEKAGKIKGKEKEGKLAFVESDDLKKLKDEKGNRLQGHSSRYEAVSIDKDGNVKALNLEEDKQKGTNPTEKNYQVKQNKNEKVEKGDVLTRLQVQGNETIGIDKGQYGVVEVYHSHDKTLGGKGVEANRSLDRELETKNAKNPIEGTDQATQKLAQKNQDGYRSVEESYQEAKQHENTKGEPCEELKVEDIDGSPNTVSHSHTEDIVAKLMQNDEISDKFTEREIRERVENAWNNKEEDMSTADFEKNIEEDIELDAENMRGERGR